MVKSVKDLEVYQRAYKTALNVHKYSLTFPKEEQFALSSQIRRSSKSICANLAEGFAKSYKSSAEFKRYGLIALGSSEEVLVWIDFAKDLGYLNEAVYDDLHGNYKIICKQLYVMIESWKS